MADEPSDERVIQLLNNSYMKKANPSVAILCSGKDGIGKIVDFNREEKSMTMVFNLGDDYTNGKRGPNTQLQGGFAGAMLDAVCAQLVVAISKFKNTVATLEQKCSFFKPVPPNTDLFATAKIIKMGRTIAFLEAELKSSEKQDAPILVKATQTLSLVTAPPRKPKKSKL